jgi:hypothetical protein
MDYLPFICHSDSSIVNIVICGAGRVTQVVEHLHSKCKALSSNPSIAKNKLIMIIVICGLHAHYWIYAEL